MDSIKFLFLSLISLLLISACKRDESISSATEGKELKLVLAKASGLAPVNSITPTEGQEFGVYLLPGGATDMTGVLEENRKFIYENGEMKLADGAGEIFYPRDASSVDLIVYSPFRSDASSTFIHSIAVQSDQDQVDIVYSKINGVNKNNPVGTLTLAHMPSKINFNLQAGQGINALELENVGITLKSFNNTAEFNLFTGTFGGFDDYADIALGTLRQATVHPNASLNKAFLFKVGDKVLEYKLASSESFEPGKIYQYLVTINLGSVEVKRVSVMDWQVNPDIINAKTFPEIEYSRIPAGTFKMGSGSNNDYNLIGYDNLNETPSHDRTINNDYYMSKYEITNAQFAYFLNIKGAKLEQGAPIVNDVSDPNIMWMYDVLQSFIYSNNQWTVDEELANKPVSCVSWYGARAFANWLGADLPTEAQWEKAARGGSTGDYFFIGDPATELEKYAWTSQNSGSILQDIGKKDPNQLMLYDIYGNVFEWILDNKPDYNQPLVDGSPDKAIIRGGAAQNAKEVANSTTRLAVGKDWTIPSIGFRVVKSSL